VRRGGLGGRLLRLARPRVGDLRSSSNPKLHRPPAQMRRLLRARPLQFPHDAQEKRTSFGRAHCCPGLRRLMRKKMSRNTRTFTPATVQQ